MFDFLYLKTNFVFNNGSIVQRIEQRSYTDLFTETNSKVLKVVKRI